MALVELYKLVQYNQVFLPCRMIVQTSYLLLIVLVICQKQILHHFFQTVELFYSFFLFVFNLYRISFILAKYCF